MLTPKQIQDFKARNKEGKATPENVQELRRQLLVARADNRMVMSEYEKLAKYIQTELRHEQILN